MIEEQYRASKIEALILASPEPLATRKITKVIEDLTPSKVAKAVAGLNDGYAQTGSSFRIREIAGGYQFYVLPEYEGVLESMFTRQRKVRLSRRPGLAQEPWLSFYTNYVLELARKQATLFQRWRTMRAICKKITQEPDSRAYTDTALTRVSEGVEEDMQLYTQTASAQSAVTRERRVAGDPLPPVRGPCSPSGHGYLHRGQLHQDRGNRLGLPDHQPSPPIPRLQPQGHPGPGPPGAGSRCILCDGNRAEVQTPPQPSKNHRAGSVGMCAEAFAGHGAELQRIGEPG